MGAPKLLQMNYSHEIKRCLLLGRKVMANLESILKIRDVTLPTNICLVKGMIFPVVMYRRESWTLKKTESQRIDAFELSSRQVEGPMGELGLRGQRDKA